MRSRHLYSCATCGRAILRARMLGAREASVCLCPACSGVDMRTHNERALVQRFLDGKDDE